MAGLTGFAECLLLVPEPVIWEVCELHFGGFGDHLGCVGAPFWSLGGDLGPLVGGPDGPRVEFNAIAAPTWGPFWGHFEASGLAFRGQEIRVILKALFD